MLRNLKESKQELTWTSKSEYWNLLLSKNAQSRRGRQLPSLQNKRLNLKPKNSERLRSQTKLEDPKRLRPRDLKGCTKLWLRNKLLSKTVSVLRKRLELLLMKKRPVSLLMTLKPNSSESRCLLRG